MKSAQEIAEDLSKKLRKPLEERPGIVTEQAMIRKYIINYAKEKCKEQKELCNMATDFMEESLILNAETPDFG